MKRPAPLYTLSLLSLLSLPLISCGIPVHTIDSTPRTPSSKLPTTASAEGQRSTLLTTILATDAVTVNASNLPAAPGSKKPSISVGVDGQGGVWYAYVTFDLRSLPSGGVVESATLVLQSNNKHGGRALGAELVVVRTTEAWSADTISWESRPAVDDRVVINVPIARQQRFERISLEDIVEDAMARGVEELGVQLSVRGETAFWKEWRGVSLGQASLGPRLEVYHKTRSPELE